MLAASKKSLASTSCCICHWLASVCEDEGESPNLTNKTTVILNLSNCHKVHFHSGKSIFNAIPSCYHYNLLEKHKIISTVLMCYNLQSVEISAMSIFLLSLTLEVFYFVLCLYTATITAPESPSMPLSQPSQLAATPFIVKFFLIGQ